MARQVLALVVALLVAPLTLHAQTTMLMLNSQPGDFIGQGLQQTYTPVDGTFTATSDSGKGVHVAFHTPDFSHWWYLDFEAATGLLTAGVYENVARYPFQGTGQPGLSVYGDGRGCNTLTGRFEVLDVTLDSTGNVTSFAATFEQHCEGMTPALFGLMLFNSGEPIPPTVTLTLGGCQHCHAGDHFMLWTRLTNPGSKSISVEFKEGFRRPDGTGTTLFGALGEHLVVTLPPGLDVTFPIVNTTWPAGGPNGVWHAEATLLDSPLGRTYSRDVTVFDVAP